MHCIQMITVFWAIIQHEKATAFIGYFQSDKMIER